jgi:hypothetical protein
MKLDAIFSSFINLRRINGRVLSALVLIVLHIISGPCFASTGKTKDDDDAKLTAKELQASLMGYADLVTTVMGQIAYKLKEEELSQLSVISGQSSNIKLRSSGQNMDESIRNETIRSLHVFLLTQIRRVIG